MAGQNHKQGERMTFKCLAVESAHPLGSARSGFIILSGHDSVACSGLGSYQGDRTARATQPASLERGESDAGEKAKTLVRMEQEWEFTSVKTLTADDQKRIRIPDAKPRQVFTYNPNPDGSITLIPVKAELKDIFPRGSLLKYLTPERDKEQLAILSGCVQGPE